MKLQYIMWVCFSHRRHFAYAFIFCTYLHDFHFSRSETQASSYANSKLVMELHIFIYAMFKICESPKYPNIACLPNMNVNCLHWHCSGAVRDYRTLHHNRGRVCPWKIWNDSHTILRIFRTFEKYWKFIFFKELIFFKKCNLNVSKNP